MTDDDMDIDARLRAAADRLVASFSGEHTDAALRGSVDAAASSRADGNVRASRSWLGVAAAIALVAGGTIAVSIVVRSERRNTADRPDATTPVPPATTEAATVTEPPATAAPTTGGPPTTTGPTTPTTSHTTTTNMGTVEVISGLFVTVSNDRPGVIDLRDATGVVGSFDLACPTARDCTVRSARVMGDTIWVAITDTDPDDPTNDIASRVLSVSRTSGDIVEYLTLRGAKTVQRAGRGVDGVIYAYLTGGYDDHELVSIDNGSVSTLDTGVSGFLLSDDGRFLAVSFSNPARSETPRIEVTDLIDGTTNAFQPGGINAGPGAWSPDGRFLIVNEQWEDGTAWVVDPWTVSPEPSTVTGVFLDGACFIDDHTIARRTWNVGCGQGDAQPGVIRLTSLDDGSTIADLGENLFGDSFSCQPDGSVTYLRRPVIDVDYSDGFSQPEPDYDAPVDLIHLTPDGTATTIISGRLRMV